MAASERLILKDPAKNEAFVFPVNPPEIVLTHGRNFTTVPIVGAMREALVSGNTKLTTVQWSSFFPRDFQADFCNYENIEKPDKSSRRLLRWMRGGTNKRKPVPLDFKITDTDTFLRVVVVDYSETRRGGEPGDIYYDLTLSQWREQEIRWVEDVEESSSSGGETRPPNPTPRTYTVVRGDFLWAIAQRFYGDGSKWPTIWKVIKSSTSITTSPAQRRPATATTPLPTSTWTCTSLTRWTIRSPRA